MYFEDLSQYEYYTTKPFLDVWNIGWLDCHHDYKRGPHDNAIINALRSLLYDEFPCVHAHVNVIRGNHPCNLCQRNEVLPPVEAEYVVGSSEIWIPVRIGIFAAPSMLLHYVSYHNYRPPEVFLEAVESLPPERPFDGQQEFELRNHASRVSR